MSRSYCGSFASVAFIVCAAVSLSASVQRPVPIQDRARGAARVVVASVESVSARYETNAYGDRLIVSHARLRIEEAIKGGTESATLAIEGGTVNGMTLRVSSLPTLSRGDRAVFFLTPRRNGEFAPFLQGQGILQLDRSNHVRGTGLTLADVRRMARGQ